MGRISLLDQAVVNQIAAGEVVERPASVVKELIENAIDAGATRITVEIRDAGLKGIRVVDNGMGMTGEDARLALERHATSKISSLSDLSHLETLGFRGEALPSVASVSRFTLITRPAGEVSGTRLVAVGGKVKSVEAVGCSPGTQVTVEDLFFNTPPRRKFLKSPKTEAGLISDVVSRFALGYPELSFNYYSGKRLHLATTGQGDPLEVLGILYGSDALENFIEIPPHAEGGVSLRGFVSRPEYTRATRHYQSFFVNRRLVHNTFLNHALEQAFSGFLTRGEFPLAVLYLEVDPEAIDVNVHPTKREVRFSNPRLVAEVIQQGIRSALAGQRLVPTSIAAGPLSVGPRGSLPIPERVYEQRLPFDVQLDPFPQQDFSFQSLRVIGQVQKTYIVAEREGEIYFIDQHAAHERIRYEMLQRERARSQGGWLLRLETALEVKLTPEQEGIYEEYRQIIAGLGYNLKREEGGTYILTTVPAELRQDPLRCFLEVLDLLRETVDVNTASTSFYARVAALFACKGAIKAGDHLCLEEMQALLEQLDATSQPGNCPHGRPTYFKLTTAELERRFQRT